MIDWPTIIGLITAVSSALGLRELIKGWAAKRTGEAQEERRRYKDALKGNRILEVRLNIELENKRKQQEYSSLLRRLLIESGVNPALIPDWPKEKEYNE